MLKDNEFQEKIVTYQHMVENAVQQARSQLNVLGEKEKKIVELAEMYLSDSKYYLGKNNFFTALATISYAEGLLDALARMDKIKIEWQRKHIPRVVAAGTFDVIHPGHIVLLRKAASHGELYVIVSRDKNARKSKGRETVFPEESRVFLVDNLKPVKKAVLGDENDILRRVVELKPDVLFLGPDQNVSEEWIKNELKKRGLEKTIVIRMNKRVKDHYPNSSTQVIMDIMRKFCLTE